MRNVRYNWLFGDGATSDISSDASFKTLGASGALTSEVASLEYSEHHALLIYCGMDSGNQNFTVTIECLAIGGGRENPGPVGKGGRFSNPEYVADGDGYPSAGFTHTPGTNKKWSLHPLGIPVTRGLRVSIANNVAVDATASKSAGTGVRVALMGWD